MFRNYFKASLRTLVRNGNYAIINISGLAIGIAVCMLIFIIIQFHGTFDNFHNRGSQIYRILTEYHHSDTKFSFTGKGVPFGLPRGLKTAFPQIQEIAPILADDNDQIALEDETNKVVKKFKAETGLFYTTPSFFRIFNFPMLAGSYESLKSPNTVLLTKEIAEKYFDRWDHAMGKTMKINNTDVVRVSGILETIPPNTQFQLGIVVSYGTGSTRDIANSSDYDGTRASFSCYVVLPEGMSPSEFNHQLKAYSRKVKSSDNKDLQIIQPLHEIHNDTQAGDFSGKTISHTIIDILWTISGFILLIACVNFINLSTAQAVNRGREIGVKKVLGSYKWQLKLQFMSETFLMVLLSVFFAFLIVLIVLPWINNILDLDLKIDHTNSSAIVLFILCISVVVTVLAGFYPAVVLSRFNPIQVLKTGINVKNLKGVTLRRSLVVFQFVIAQVLIICTLIIIRQMKYFSTQSLGFDKDAIVNIPLPTDSLNNSKLSYLKKEFAGISGIQHISFSSNTPIEDNEDNWSMFNFDHSPKRTDFYSIIKLADHDYVPTYKLPLIAGRNLNPSDTVREFLVNEMLLKNLGITDPFKALNKEIKLNDRTKGPIVGVIKDFYARSFRSGLAPMLITSLKANYNQASMKLSTNDVTITLHAIEKIWNAVFPDFVFEYKFLDDKVENFYRQEGQLSQLYKMFAAISIFLSCLGLYGLSSFMAVQRLKEVGIRKVLGASMQSIIYLFSREFVLLIFISFLIAAPFAWYYMHEWLQNFAFRIEISWWIFGIGGLSSILIALTTVSFQAVKAALTNPINSLKGD